MKEIIYLQRKERGRPVELARIEDKKAIVIDLVKKEIKETIKLKTGTSNFIEEYNYQLVNRKTWFTKARKSGLQINIELTQLSLFHANQLQLF